MVEMITYDPEIFNETWNKISNVTEKRMKQYKLNTHLISGYRKDEEIPKEVRDDLISEGCPESWFSPVEEEVKEGDWVVNKNYGGGIFRVEEVEEDRIISHTKQRRALATDYRPATKKEIEEHLIAEAKRRYDDSDKILDARYERNKYEISNLSNFYYQEKYDALCGLGGGNGTVYCKGKWAPIVDEPIQINGIDIEWNANKDALILGCGDRIAKTRFDFFFDIVRGYDLEIYRQDENITKQIKKIAKRIES